MPREAGGDSFCHVVVNGELFVGSHATRNMPSRCHVVLIHTVMFSQRFCILEVKLPETCREKLVVVVVVVLPLQPSRGGCSRPGEPGVKTTPDGVVYSCGGC